MGAKEDGYGTKDIFIYLLLSWVPNIDVYGFDYDYTLVRYTSEVHRLIYDYAKNMLVDKLMVSDNCMSINILVNWMGSANSWRGVYKSCR